MANMGPYRPKNAHEYQNTYYANKTSDHGHYVPEITGKRHGRDGSQAKITTMRWVEDKRSFETPAAKPKPEADPEPKLPTTPVVYSPEIQQAKERVAKYESDSLSGKMTDDIYRVNELDEQDQKYIFDSQQLSKSFLDKEQFQFNQARYNS